MKWEEGGGWRVVCVGFSLLVGSEKLVLTHAGVSGVSEVLLEVVEGGITAYK